MDITPQLFIYSNAGMSTVYSISAAVVTMVGITLTIDKRLDVRNIITAPIAGGVIIGSSSANIYNPLEAILMGILAALMQYVFNKV
jgi:ammonia channel protein AmtB